MRLYRQIIVAAVALLLAGSLIYRLAGIAADVPVLVDIEQLPVIVIDPGHGGIDGGAVSRNGSIIEKDINLSMGLMLRDFFIINGFDVVMTRDTDISIHDDGVKGVRKQKTSDLHNRLDIAEAFPNAIFISIHQNKFEQAGSWGAQVFYGPNNSQSKALAELLQSNVRDKIQPDNKREIKRAGKNLYLMYNASCPSILVECGFLSNPADAANLVDPEYQSKFCFTVMASVMKYLEIDVPMTASLE